MAEGPDPLEKGLKELGEEITCSICLQHFRDPKVLPCCHYYCSECIRQLAARAGPNQPFPCPQCREDTLLPQNDPSQLHTAFFVNRLKELYAKMEKAEGKVEVICESCSGGKADAFCRQCTDFICQDCVKSHRKLKVFAGHEVVTLEELRKGGANHIPLKKAPPMMCKEHDEQIKIFCFDCDHLICRDCIVIDHAGHRYEFVKKTAPQCREELKNQLAPLQKLTDDLLAATKRIEATKTKVSNQGADVAANIKESFAKLRDVLTQREQELLKTASSIIQRKLDTLTVQEKNLHLASVEIQSLVEFVERNRSDATDEELIMIHKQILSRVGEECEKHLKTSLEPADGPNLIASFPTSDSIANICQKDAKLHLLAKYAVDGAGTRNAEVDKEAQIILRAADRNGDPSMKEQTVEASLKSLVNGSATPVKVVPTGDGTYKLTYCPKIRGRHSLTISVNGHPIPGSPFPVFVKIHPSKLGKPVRVIGGLNNPWGIAFNSQQQLVVSEWGGKQVKVLDGSGKALCVFKHPKFQNPTGVAVDVDDNIYVGDPVGALIKFSRNGQCQKVIEKGNQPGEVGGVRSVKIIDDKVYVCDYRNRIQVFTRELEFVKSFGSNGSGKGQFNNPEDIVQDQRGNLYVTDRVNNRVQVFTNEWEFMHELRAGKLKQPSCACFDTSGFLYVGSYENHSVSVFNPTDELVTSFCKMGEKEGELKHPWRMAFDEDGFLYVCDFGNNRIQVF